MQSSLIPRGRNVIVRKFLVEFLGAPLAKLPEGVIPRPVLTASRGEFTVAKDQNIRLRTGWFSDRTVRYLASGKPVVISPLPEYEPMSDVLRIGRSRDQFLSLVEEALHEKGTQLMRARQEAVRTGTWDARAEWVSGLIERALSAKKTPSPAGRGLG